MESVSVCFCGAPSRAWHCLSNALQYCIQMFVGGLYDLSRTLFHKGSALMLTSSHFWQTGIVYAVEFSHRSGRDLVNMAKKRTNVIPIIEDARHPARYRMLVGMVDVIFADVAQPDQVSFREENSLSVFVLVVVMFCISPLFFPPSCSCASDLLVPPFSALCSVRISQSLKFFPLSLFSCLSSDLHTQPTSVCSSMGC
jgi:hypothetical protein